MILNDVHRGIRKNRPRKRIGRGTGSGHGKTAGRGHKGQNSRAGTSRLAIFQGGQMPAVRKIPKRGFNNRFGLRVAAVNVSVLEAHFAAGDEVTPETISAKRLTRGRFDQLKLLGDGTLTKKLKVSAHRFSESARQKIEQAGGQAVVLPGPAPVAKNKQRTAAGSAE